VARGRNRAAIAALGLLTSLALMAPAPASAALTPVVECQEPNPSTGTRWVYFGYVNDGAPMNIEFGAQNQVIPGFGFQGQPTVFNTGSYPRVFRAVFNQNVFNAIAWDLNGIQAIATDQTPFCASGATGPVSDLTTTGATLNGLVESRSVETTYSFEYGPTIAYGQSTPERTLTSPTAKLVSEPLTGLAPETTYHYRLVSDGSVATAGEDRTFTTPAEPPETVEGTVQPEAKPRKCKRKRGAKKKCRKGKRKP
jgi:hypothetical protein